MRREDGAALLAPGTVLVVAEAVEDAPGEAAVPEEEGMTNGDEPVVRLRGAYAEGTVTTMLSRSKKELFTPA